MSKTIIFETCDIASRFIKKNTEIVLQETSEEYMLRMMEYSDDGYMLNINSAFQAIKERAENLDHDKLDGEMSELFHAIVDKMGSSDVTIVLGG